MNFPQFILHSVKNGIDLASRDFPNFVQLLLKWSRKYTLDPFHRQGAGPQGDGPPAPSFVIICRARTGSNFLTWLLDSHPNIWPLAEPFGPYELQKTWVQKQLIQHGLLTYLDHQLHPKAGNLMAGIKILYKQLEPGYAQEWALAELSDVIPFFQTRQNLKIIHLKRRNRLRSFISTKIVNLNQTFILFDPKKRDNDIVLELTVDECETAFRQIEQLEAYYDQCFAEHQVLELFYEELTTNTVAEGKRILAFLALDDRPLKAMTVKQNTRPLNQIVTNYAMLKQHFADTPWSCYFDE